MSSRSRSSASLRTSASSASGEDVAAMANATRRSKRTLADADLQEADDPAAFLGQSYLANSSSRSTSASRSSSRSVKSPKAGSKPPPMDDDLEEIFEDAAPASRSSRSAVASRPVSRASSRSAVASRPVSLASPRSSRQSSFVEVMEDEAQAPAPVTARRSIGYQSPRQSMSPAAKRSASYKQNARDSGMLASPRSARQSMSPRSASFAEVMEDEAPMPVSSRRSASPVASRASQASQASRARQYQPVDRPVSAMRSMGYKSPVSRQRSPVASYRSPVREQYQDLGVLASPVVSRRAASPVASRGSLSRSMNKDGNELLDKIGYINQYVNDVVRDGQGPELKTVKMLKNEDIDVLHQLFDPYTNYVHGSIGEHQVLIMPYDLIYNDDKHLQHFMDVVIPDQMRNRISAIELLDLLWLINILKHDTKSAQEGIARVRKVYNSSDRALKRKFKSDDRVACVYEYLCGGYATDYEKYKGRKNTRLSDFLHDGLYIYFKFIQNFDDLPVMTESDGDFDFGFLVTAPSLVIKEHAQSEKAKLRRRAILNFVMNNPDAAVDLAKQFKLKNGKSIEQMAHGDLDNKLRLIDALLSTRDA